MTENADNKKHANNNGQYMFVIRQLARRDIKRGTSSAILGQLWNVINPFIYMITMVIIFSAVLKNNLPNFPVYVLTGNIIYTLFNSGTTGAMKSLVSSKSFLVRTRISKNIFVIEKVYVAFINMLYSMIGYVVLLIVTGVTPNPYMFLVPVDIAICLVMIIGIGKILAVINVFFADIEYFYHILMLLFMYGSAIFYSTDGMAPAVQMVMSVNPIYIAISIARICVMDGYAPGPMLWVKLVCYAVGFYLLGTFIFNRGTQDIVAEL